MPVLVSDVYNFINEIAPFNKALEYDNTGLLVGDLNSNVNKIGVCLDITGQVVEQAITLNCNLIISHHPIIFTPLKSLLSDSIVYKLAENNISAICAHTNLDSAKDGVNDCLCNALEIRVTESIADPKYENYPPIARLGTLAKEMNPQEFAAFVKEKLNCPDVRFCSKGKSIKKVAVCGGASSELLSEVYQKGADAFITSEVKHHEWLIANNLDLTVIDAGHFSTEYVVVDSLCQKIKDKFNINCFSFIQTAPYNSL